MDVVLLPACSPELNPIELIFNVMVQKFNSACDESEIFSNEDVLNLLCAVVDSMTTDVMFACYQKCGHDNFF